MDSVEELRDRLDGAIRRCEVAESALAEIVMACTPLGWATDGTPQAAVAHVREVVRRWQVAERAGQ